MSKESFAQKARRVKSEKAKAMGVDDSLISELVETFYGHIRTHDVLGPIFASKIENWEPHLAIMKNFWASIILESGRYHGNPMGKHLAIDGLNADHFMIWLSLWDATIEEVGVSKEAAFLFRDRAARIAKSLKIGTGIEEGSFGIIKSSQ